MTCPDDNLLVAYGAGGLDAETARALELHFDGCEDCRTLVAEAASHELTDAPSGPSPSRADDASLEPVVVSPGTRLGRYVVLERIGAGGMGAVFSAFDPRLARKVALKLLHPSDEGQAELQLRLLHEAQAMARLSHPNVVSVHDVGTWEGRVWVAMEYVAGSTLRQWLAVPERTDAERLQSLVEAGRGLSAAHAAGLVHRDFKPDNVLVGTDRRICVTDFGLARAGRGPPESSPRPAMAELVWSVDASDTTVSSTRTGTLVGTPAYMAPEQIAGIAADARSDQFAFCVVAWEAWARRRPFDLEGLRKLATRQLEETRRMSSGAGSAPGRSVRDTGASSLTAPSGMPAWVHRCLLRGMSLRPEDRFPSMEALLEVLGDDPRLRWRQRALALGAALLLVGSGTALAWQQHQAASTRCSGGEAQFAEIWNPRVRQTLTEGFVATGVPSAAALVEKTTAAIEGYGGQWRAMHREACEATRVRGEQTEDELSLRMACLDRRREGVRGLIQLLTAPDERLVLRATDAVLGLDGVSQCGDLVALRAPIPPPDSEEVRAALPGLHVLLSEATALTLAGRFKEAQEKAGRAEEGTAKLGYPPVEAEAVYQVALLLDRTGDLEGSIRRFEDAFRIAEAGRSDVLKARTALRLGYSHFDARRTPEAWFWLGLAESTIKRLGGNRELEADLAGNQGTVLRSEGRRVEAIAAYRRSLQLMQSELGEHHSKVAIAMRNLGDVLVQDGRTEEGFGHLRTSIGIIEAVNGKDHVLLAWPLTSLAHAEVKVGLLEEAVAHVEKATALVRKAYGPRHRRYSAQLDHQGTILQAAGRFDASLAAYSESLVLKRELLGPEDQDLSYPLDGVGHSLLGLGRAGEALAPFEAALKIRGGEPQDLGDTKFGLARALWEVGKGRSRARALAAQAVVHFEEARDARQAAAARAFPGTP